MSEKNLSGNKTAKKKIRQSIKYLELTHEADVIKKLIDHFSKVYIESEREEGKSAKRRVVMAKMALRFLRTEDGFNYVSWLISWERKEREKRKVEKV